MKPYLLLLITCFAVLSSGCPGILKGKAAASQGVSDFHQAYNEGKTEAIYDTANAKFKSATGKKEFLDLLGAVQRKLGKVTGTAEAGYNVRTFNFTTMVMLNQSTTFE